jgi:glycerophosphoryl diester phosphodiesterase
MKKLLRILGLIVLIPVGLLFLLIVVMSIISPPRGGKKTAAALQVPYPAVVAHRGLSGLAPEATLPAYLLARECGADYLEADLQRTADGVIIVFHDDTPARTTNAARVFPGRENDPIGSFTYAELTELDAGSWFNEAFPELARAAYAGLKILTLDELIDIAEGGNNNPGLYLETKAPSSYPGIEAQIVEILRARGWIGGPAPKPAPPDPSLNAAVGAPSVNVAATPARVIFQSFDPASVARLKELAPDAPRVLLVSQEIAAEKGWAALVEQAAATAQGIGPVGYLGWPWNIGPAHRAGLVVHVYTINESWQFKLLSRFGSDGFFTDRSDRAVELLGRGGPLDVGAVFRRIGY